MKAEKQKPKGNPRKPRKTPAAGKPAQAGTPVGAMVAPTTTRRKLSPTCTPAELEEADRFLSTLWNNPSSGWRNRLQGLRVASRKNWVAQG